MALGLSLPSVMATINGKPLTCDSETLYDVMLGAPRMYWFRVRSYRRVQWCVVVALFVWIYGLWPELSGNSLVHVSSDGELYLALDKQRRDSSKGGTAAGDNLKAYRGDPGFEDKQLTSEEVAAVERRLDGNAKGANTAFVDPNDPTKLMPESQGGVKVNSGGASLKGAAPREGMEPVCDKTIEAIVLWNLLQEQMQEVAGLSIPPEGRLGSSMARDFAKLIGSGSASSNLNVVLDHKEADRHKYARVVKVIYKGGGAGFKVLQDARGPTMKGKKRVYDDIEWSGDQAGGACQGKLGAV